MRGMRWHVISALCHGAAAHADMRHVDMPIRLPLRHASRYEYTQYAYALMSFAAMPLPMLDVYGAMASITRHAATPLRERHGALR